ncbi:histidine kinase [Labilibaculum sp. DW002]|uniref:Histidine kinase n=1 Tax=Paralabilibaculum antarcticum TaxID=2912572 RepID=A0ABT5VYG6_9BACT|nr:histidine kinase [Labilibaculum sp. DW002]MDE5420460.1 histidine kinase [Labilibaculum sp. DW002]
MNLIELLRKIKFVPLHMLFWGGVWLFYIYFFGFNSANQPYVIWFSNILVPVTIVTTYFVIYFLIPNYLLKKKHWYFLLYGIYTLIASAYLITISMFLGFMFKTELNTDLMPPLSKSLPFILIGVYLVVALVSAFKLLRHNYESIERNKSLENKILEAQLQIKNQELQYLKKQIHPHFLFNTLNTIYGFALKQSKSTPLIILKLSNLLDYILYQIEKPKVSLKEEVLHIEEYIELEKMRFQDSLKVNFKSQPIPDTIQVTPMLLIPFVENAFKHGQIIDGFLRVDVEIFLKNNSLNFSIKNTIRSTDEKKSIKGIGLDNIQKRLQLLYQDQYQLEIENQDHWFSVNLMVNNLNASIND